MSLAVVGSVAYDAIETPHGKRDRTLGGACTYIALSASFFTQPMVVGVVGEDFAREDEQLLREKGIDLQGLETVPGKTFFWSGVYSPDMNDRTTLQTDLNVFADFQPKLPPSYPSQPYLFLGNIQPSLQRDVQQRMDAVRFVGGDTMNYWINSKHKELIEALKQMNILLINDTETKMLAQDASLPRAARKVLDLGPRALVVKHGEYGATIFFRDGEFEGKHHPFRAPALPLEEVVDPTGAGDSFAGGFMGYLASQKKLTRSVLKQAMFYGSVMGSFAVERFGTERLETLTRDEVEERIALFRDLTHLD
jgi:sugar/nucleoside kinase (ribokinase family)